MMNNNSIQVLGENDSYESHQYTFGGVGEVYDRFMMDLAGAAETPTVDPMTEVLLQQQAILEQMAQGAETVFLWEV